MRNIILSFLLLLTLSPLQGNALHLPLYAEGSFDFADGAAEAEEYAYDGCGALVMDLNRGIDNIEYDNLGHLKEIRFANKEYILYVYDPLGRKWQVRHSFDRDDEEDPGQGGIDISDVFVTGPVTSYGPGGTVYVDGALDRFLFPGGYATPKEGGGLRMHYYTCDHQGNVRVVMGEDGTLEQVTHYYPFGGIYGDAGLNAGFQPYKYNGKELDRMHGLDWYDYGARQYDAAGVPVFTTIDPMAEKYYHLSPYAYCANNPVKYIDKNGETPWKVLGRMAFKVANRGISALWETATYADIVYEMANDVSILMDADASWTDKGWAVYDLFSPVGAKETKAGIQLLKSKAAKVFETSRAARREVMREQGIPTSQQPKSQSKNDSGREYRYDMPDKYGETKEMSVQQQTLDRSHQEQPHWEAGSVKVDNNGETRLNSYGRPKLDSNKEKEYYYDEEYKRRR